MVRRAAAVVGAVGLLLVVVLFAARQNGESPQRQQGTLPGDSNAVPNAKTNGLQSGSDPNTASVPRQNVDHAGGAGPADCVSAMVVAEQAGDVDAYLDRLGGPLRETLEAQAATKPKEEIAAQLRGATTGMTGHATSNLKFPQPGPNGTRSSATLVLERIYRDYNERFNVRLERIGGEWKVVNVEPMERYAPEIRYGTPVYVPPKKEDEQQ